MKQPEFFNVQFFTTKEEAQKRYDICKQCDKLEMPLAQCRECKCFMKIKVKAKEAYCPLGKW